MTSTQTQLQIEFALQEFEVRIRNEEINEVPDSLGNYLFIKVTIRTKSGNRPLEGQFII